MMLRIEWDVLQIEVDVLAAQDRVVVADLDGVTGDDDLYRLLPKSARFGQYSSTADLEHR